MARVDRIGVNAGHAREVVDDYVWFFGEAAKWWPHGNATQTWEQEMPGIIANLWLARNPERAEARVSDGAQLLQNGEFRSGLSGWSSWQDNRPSGEIAVVGGQLRMIGVSSGCVTQMITVQPNERYAVWVSSQARGDQQSSVTVRWKTAEGKWTAEPYDRQFARGGWVVVPKGAERLVVLLCAAGRGGPKDVAIFQSAKLVKL